MLFCLAYLLLLALTVLANLARQGRLRSARRPARGAAAWSGDRAQRPAPFALSTGWRSMDAPDWRWGTRAQLPAYAIAPARLDFVLLDLSRLAVEQAWAPAESAAWIVPDELAPAPALAQWEAVGGSAQPIWVADASEPAWAVRPEAIGLGADGWFV